MLLITDWKKSERIWLKKKAAVKMAGTWPMLKSSSHPIKVKMVVALSLCSYLMETCMTKNQVTA
jgi:hypothetical protein